MTKFELARTAGRWRPRSRTYVALASLFVTAGTTNADVLHDAFAVWCPSIDAEGEMSSHRGHLRPLLLHSSSARPRQISAMPMPNKTNKGFVHGSGWT